MDTGSSFLGGGWGSSFGGGGALSAALGGFPPSQGFSSGMLNQNQGFGTRGPMAFGSNGLMEGMQNGFDWAGRQQQAQYAQQLQAQQNAAELQRTGIMARAETLPARLAQQRWNKTFPYVTGTLNSLMSGGGGLGGPAGLGAPPTITQAPVWTDQQIQARVNATRAQNDQSTAGQIRNIQQQTAGRGFGANSPLAQALSGQAQAANLATNTQAENDLRFNTADANAKQLLASQEAGVGAWQAQAQAALDQQKIRAGVLSSMLGTLGSIGR